MEVGRYLKEGLLISLQQRLREFAEGIGKPTSSLKVHRQIVSLLEKPDPVILDIGCNDGSDARRFLQLRPKAQLFCFEPDPRAAARCRENMGPLDRMRLFEVAISDRVGRYLKEGLLISLQQRLREFAEGIGAVTTGVLINGGMHI
ncbi:SAM-dependent methyltransferase [Sinorhizobium fredii]